MEYDTSIVRPDGLMLVKHCPAGVSIGVSKIQSHIIGMQV